MSGLTNKMAKSDEEMKSHFNYGRGNRDKQVEGVREDKRAPCVCRQGTSQNPTACICLPSCSPALYDTCMHHSRWRGVV